MTAAEAKIGTRVRSLRDFSRVPKGTEGVIDEDYGRGVMVAWDLSHIPLPEGYAANPGRFRGPPWRRPMLLRDGFLKATELEWLEVVK